MADPFIGEIRAVAFNFAPVEWASCWGQTMQSQQNQALYALLATQFGGNGQTTFQLPDLRGRCAIGQGQGTGLTNRTVGQFAGTENTQLQVANMPTHNHTVAISGTGAVTFKMSGDQADADDPTGAITIIGSIFINNNASGGSDIAVGNSPTLYNSGNTFDKNGGIGDILNN